MGVIVDSNELGQFFNVYDTNRSGTLDYKEFSDIVFNKGQFTSPSGGKQGGGGSTTQAYRGLKEYKILIMRLMHFL